METFNQVLVHPITWGLYLCLLLDTTQLWWHQPQSWVGLNVNKLHLLFIPREQDAFCLLWFSAGGNLYSNFCRRRKKKTFHRDYWFDMMGKKVLSAVSNFILFILFFVMKGNCCFMEYRKLGEGGGLVNRVTSNIFGIRIGENGMG